MTGILTGASGGIGGAVRRELEAHGYSVIALQSRLEKLADIQAEIKRILQQRDDIAFLINAAGVGIFEPMETLSLATIERLIAVNLTAPIALSKLLLPVLKRNGGTIVNITSIEAVRAAKYSALYSATKAGLRHFSHTLFEEVRKEGVSVCSINPDVTATPFFDNNNLKFCPKDGTEFALDPNELAVLVRTVLESDGSVTDLTIRPQKIGIVKR